MNKTEVLAKTDELFKLADEKRLARVDEKGKALKDNHRGGSYITYRDDAKRVIRTIINVVNPRLGRTAAKYNNPLFWDKETVEKYLEIRCEQSIKGEIAPKTIAGEMHAIDALRQFSNNKEINVFSGHKKIKIGGYEVHRERLSYIKEEVGSYSYKTSSWAKMRMNEAHTVMKHLSGPYSEWARNVLDTVIHTGARSTTAFMMEKRHIVTENNYTRLEYQKGNKKTNLPMTEFGMAVMNEKKEKAKNPGSLLHSLKGPDGKELSNKQKQKILDRYVSKAAEKAGIELPDNKKFTVHSFRKSFGQNIYDSTRGMNRDEINRKINEFLALQGANAKVIQDRMNREKRRINKYNIERGRSTREFTVEELRAMYTSLMLSHSRLDIVSHYVNRDIKQHEPDTR
ncbi:tyrosine-type recombinase/integrase [Niallia sp.]|uniref:tyrosine-type recombinase/integrase n=1 Tax=Niallia sp. TaxID=2837523 RepID=UPI0028A17F61|nr:tyrosine-type recombinase/integrase [Niallia sp.]